MKTSTTKAPRRRTSREEPTPSDLGVIEAEWPAIAAELAVVDAECLIAAAPASALAWRAHRRAVRALLALAVHPSAVPSVVPSTCEPATRPAAA